MTEARTYMDGYTDLIARLRAGCLPKGIASHWGDLQMEAADALEGAQRDLDAYLARLAEIEKQEPVAYFDVCVNGDVGAVRFIPHHGEPLKSGDKLYASAGASPVEPSQAQPPAPSDAAREYMTGYSDGREWAKP